ncbi:acyl-CoA dehydrogenase family protein [Mycolicibacterium aichiense]|uniref:Acyl-CoA dehydrogenase n=1 Tax=Mycolicibacterium aichiense TaxID=1799 RepID=A0AAD1HXD0_9MYCO|nr:acyl-CoA dehydrogenase family protein [Mycolicibacterium aichiense]MCV7017111.1 acyl-CoA/acyl-ACP dehydrogenase [Mycolicibacterium aichiense]BBX10461.1 acyl-CoA dehydrogenase [Mycolicibacterium aichiense]STZ25881.1 acyl-CoA dehydrogenase domain-containing protein [Mycolicibacterium aichiense]
MDFQYSSEHTALRDSTRDFLDVHGSDERGWNRLCTELELPGLAVPVEYGGVGATLVESAIVFEEFGRALSPLPLASHVFAVHAVLCLGDDEQRHRLLPGLLGGTLRAAFAVTGPNAGDAASATVSATGGAGHTVLDGVCGPVLHGHGADLLVVAACTGDDMGLYVVDTATPGVGVTPLPSFDASRPVARVTLGQAAAERLDAAPDALDQVLDTARVLLAAEMLGGAEACLARSIEYACSRSQFDRPIGTFQAVKHMCAEMAIEIDATRVAVMFAAMSADDPGELAVAAPLVKAQAADTFTLCANTATQVHGGIAFTWEHDLHRYLRRAKTCEALFGNSSQHRALLADRVGL